MNPDDRRRIRCKVIGYRSLEPPGLLDCFVAPLLAMASIGMMATATPAGRRTARRSRPTRPWPARRGACGPCSPAPLEVAVRGRGAALAGLKFVRVHGEAHRAAGLAPLEAGGEEDFVEPLRLGLRLNEAGTRHDHGVDALIDLAALRDPGCGAQVLDAAVGARANEDAVDLDVGDLLATLQPHIVERTHHCCNLHAARPLRWVLEIDASATASCCPAENRPMRDGSNTTQRRRVT